MSSFPLALYIALIFIRPMEWWEPLQGYPLVNGAAIFTILFAFPEIMRDHLDMWRKIPQVKVALLFSVCVPASFLPVFFLSAMSASFQVFGKVIVLYMLVLLAARDPRNLRFLMWVVIICTLWLAWHTILLMSDPPLSQGFGDALARWRPDKEIYQPRAYGIFADPNDLCLVFVIAIPMLYAEFRGADNPMIRAFTLPLMAMEAYAAWLTNSRGGIVGLLGMAAAYAVSRAKGWRRWFFGGGTIGFILFVAPSRFAGGFAVDVGRLNSWGEGLAYWKSGLRPMLFGVGFGSYKDVTEDYMAAHNSFIEPLVELGLVGYIPFFLLIYLTVLYSYRLATFKNELTKKNRFYNTGLYSALIGYLAAAYFLSRAYNHVLYVTQALLVAQVWTGCRDHNLYPQVFGPLKKDVRRGVMTALISVILIWLSVRLGNLGR